eukprot:Pgem_evm1s17316
MVGDMTSRNDEVDNKTVNPKLLSRFSYSNTHKGNPNHNNVYNNANNNNNNNSDSNTNNNNNNIYTFNNDINSKSNYNTNSQNNSDHDDFSSENNDVCEVNDNLSNNKSSVQSESDDNKSEKDLKEGDNNLLEIINNRSNSLAIGNKNEPSYPLSKLRNSQSESKLGNYNRTTDMDSVSVKCMNTNDNFEHGHDDKSFNSENSFSTFISQ